MSVPNIIAAIAVALFLLGVVLWIVSYVGRIRRHAARPPEYFIQDEPSRDALCGFLRSCLCVPDTILGFGSQSQLTPADLSRLVTLWAALGADATLCYGFVDEHKRHPFRSAPGSYATIWVEFRYEGEPWVYWYCNDASIVEPRRDFYRRGAATILHDLRFADAGARLFKD